MPRAVLQRNLSAWEINIERTKVKQSFSLPGAHSRSLYGYHLLCLSDPHVFNFRTSCVPSMPSRILSLPFAPSLSLSSWLACPLLYCPGPSPTASVWALRPLCWLNPYEFRINKEFYLFGINEEFVQPIRDLFNKEFAHFFLWARFRTCNQSNKHAPLEIGEFWPGCRMFWLSSPVGSKSFLVLCVCSSTHVCMHVETRGQTTLGFSLQATATRQSRLTAGVPPGTFACLYLSSAWPANMHHHAQLFSMGSGDRTQVLVLERRTLL